MAAQHAGNGHLAGRAVVVTGAGGGSGKHRPGRLHLGEVAPPPRRRRPGEVVHAIDQPWGVTIGDVTIRATGEDFVL